MMSPIVMDRDLTGLPERGKGFPERPTLRCLGEPWTFPQFPVISIIPLMIRAVKRMNDYADR